MTSLGSSSPNRLWPRSTSLLLLIVGLVLSVASFTIVMSMPELNWHGARDAELRATYSTYQETGVLLIKPTGSGSYGVQAPPTGPLASAAWDDDPGAYIIASLLGKVTHADSPYPGLTLIQALLVALPLLWLPMAVARLFRSARAGYSLLLLPLVVWLTNHGSKLIGTEYGLSDQVSSLPVYTLYGFAASFAFLSLSLLLLFSTYRLRISVLLGASLLISVLAGVGNLTRSLSGMGVAVAVGILWWLHTTGRWRWVVALAASVLALGLAVGVPNGVMSLVNADRTKATAETLEQIPNAHTAWHSLYLGLSYPQPLTGEPSRFDVTWADEFGWEKAREVDPDVVVASEEYDEILKSLYLSEITDNPVGALKLYVLKSIFLLKHFGLMVGFITLGFLAAFVRLSRPRRSLGITLAVVLPTLALGLIPPIMVMPMLYYYSELSAALGILTAVALGALAWSLSTAPSHIRSVERQRVADDPPERLYTNETECGVSIVFTGVANDAELAQLTGEMRASLTSMDEIIFVERHASLQSKTSGLEPKEVQDFPDYRRLGAVGDIGEALRAGVLASRGRAVLVATQAIALGRPAREALHTRPGNVILATGSSIQIGKGARGTWSTQIKRAIPRFLLQADLEASYSVFAVDGTWARRNARISRESTTMWMTEMVHAAVTQGFVAKPLPDGVHAQSTESSIARPSVKQILASCIRLAVNRSHDTQQSPLCTSEQPTRAGSLS